MRRGSITLFLPRSHRLYLWLLAGIVLGFSSLCAEVPYRVEFTGDIPYEVHETLENLSQLVILQESHPPSMVSLRRRAVADIPYLMQALHSFAYYNAEVDIDIDESVEPVVVEVKVSLGSLFRLISFKIIPECPPASSECDDDSCDSCTKGQDFLTRDFLAECSDCEDSCDVADVCRKPVDTEWDHFDLEELGIELGDPAIPLTILEAEDALLEWMNSQGYPLAQIVRHEIVADQSNHTVAVKVFVTTGELAYLRFPTISGQRRVCWEYIARKVDWRAGDLYCPEQIACTFNSLEASGLFRSINIELGSEADEDGLLPVDIVVNEGKQRSIAAGVVYSSEWGAGVIAEWAHRNVGGMGEQLSLKTEAMEKYQTALISYRTPDFLCCKGLDWLNTFEGEREITDSYRETSWTTTSQLYRQLTPRLHIWAGAAVKYLYSTDSDNDRHFTLLKLPGQLRYSSADNLLDPHYGASMNIKVTPTTGIVPSSLTYCTARYDGAVYVPVKWLSCLTLAGKLTLGTIVGASRFDIPPPERFYAGSPNTLRGYRYLTVSPLDAENKPEGGRSIFVISLEIRQRLSENWGLVGFWDWGNVYSPCWPQLEDKQLRSIGLGLRYYTPVGPLRFDFAYPMDRRPGIDAPYQFYFSIGQTY